MENSSSYSPEVFYVFFCFVVLTSIKNMLRLDFFDNILTHFLLLYRFRDSNFYDGCSLTLPVTFS